MDRNKNTLHTQANPPSYIHGPGKKKKIAKYIYT